MGIPGKHSYTFGTFTLWSKDNKDNDRDKYKMLTETRIRNLCYFKDYNSKKHCLLLDNLIK